MSTRGPLINLSGKVIVVTGANSGIGLGIARGVARAGGSVAVWGRRADRNDLAVAELAALGARAEGFVCDVADEPQVKQSMKATLDAFGRIDGLVANAGTSGRSPFVEMSTA
jgi:NAD(P)-dependent dehydrogenase (short-subunit alcohol dehydrogenase family)